MLEDANNGVRIEKKLKTAFCCNLVAALTATIFVALLSEAASLFRFLQLAYLNSVV
jgi:hypothetical protein